MPDLRQPEQLALCALRVLRLAAPAGEHRRLQGAAVRERQRPRLAAGHLVDGVQVDGGVGLRLAAGQERDACERHTSQNDT